LYAAAGEGDPGGSNPSPTLEAKQGVANHAYRPQVTSERINQLDLGALALIKVQEMTMIEPEFGWWRSWISIS
jgi:hypothetical protein